MLERRSASAFGCAMGWERGERKALPDLDCLEGVGCCDGTTGCDAAGDECS